MAEPIIVNCPKNQWTIIDTNITDGDTLWKVKPGAKYMFTYRDTGNPAPSDLSDAVDIFEDRNYFKPTPAVASDFYIYCLGGDGIVRIDT